MLPYPCPVCLSGAPRGRAVDHASFLTTLTVRAIEAERMAEQAAALGPQLTGPAAELARLVELEILRRQELCMLLSAWLGAAKP